MNRFSQSLKLPSFCLCLVLSLLFAVAARAGEIYTKMPDKIDPSAHYVFYMHGGKIPEGMTSYEHMVMGVYDLPTITKGLEDPAYHVIAYVRPYKMEEAEAGQKLAGEVQTLLKAGVAPERITLVGFSFGAVAVIMASFNLENEKINIGLLAGCAGRVMWESELAVWGRVLSLYDKDDDLVASCKVLQERGGKITSFEEQVLETGKGHPLFFSPDPVWVAPLKRWIKGATK